MIPDRSTPVPNIIFDHYLPILKAAELTLLLVIIRQTLGWSNGRKQGRKYCDWISGSQLRAKTGYSRKAISMALEGLVAHKLVRVHDEYGRVLATAEERQGKLRLFYAFCTDVSLRTPLHITSTSDQRTLYLHQKKALEKKMTLV
jgi:hypothetical protein